MRRMKLRGWILFSFLVHAACISYAQSSKHYNSQLSKGSGSEASAGLTFTELPEAELVFNEGDVIPDPFEVKAVTTCKGELESGGDNENPQHYYVGSYQEFVAALQLAQDGDVINLSNHVAIKPDASFPNHLGVWEPFVLNKAIIIDGGADHNTLSFERGLPLELRADITFKDMNLTMIPEGGVNASFIYVSDSKAIFDNVSTTVDVGVAGVSDPRPTLVAGTYGTHDSAGEQAHIIIRNATYESTFAAILAGNQNTVKTTNTLIDIESEDLVVKEGVKLCGLDDSPMIGESLINTSSKRIKHYQGFEGGGASTLNFVEVSVIPQVTVLNIDDVQLKGLGTRVSFLDNSEGLNSVSVSEGAELTVAANADNNFSLALLCGPGTLVIPQYSTLMLGAVCNRPVVKVREWLYLKENILDFVVFGDEQAGDIIYHVNEEMYIRQDGQLEVYDSPYQPLIESYDASVQYMGETVELRGSDQVITRRWRAFDACGNEAFFEQSLIILSSVISSIEEVADLSFFIYPNPAANEFGFNRPELVQSLRIYDVNGRLLRSFPKKSSYQIDGLPSGLYFLVVKHAHGYSQFKLRKE